MNDTRIGMSGTNIEEVADVFGKKKLRDEIIRLSYRIAELEERLCPCESHDWRKIDYNLFGGTGVGDEETIYTYKCAKCGKQLKTWKVLV